jgi:hypothetical protein
MARIMMAYIFTAVMLLSQLGLPLHMHYCKGMLESVSVFFSLGCDNHEAHQNEIPLKSCCQKDITKDCSNEKDGCCDDQIKLLTQEITSVSPNILKWVVVPAVIDDSHINSSPLQPFYNFSNPYLPQGTDTGPPIYLMHHALIFYG